MRLNAKLHLPGLTPPNPIRWFVANPRMGQRLARPRWTRRREFWAAAVESMLAAGEATAPLPRHDDAARPKTAGYAPRTFEWVKALNPDAEPVSKTIWWWLMRHWDRLGGQEGAWRLKPYRPAWAMTPGRYPPGRDFGMRTAWQDAILRADMGSGATRGGICGVLMLLPSGQLFICDDLLLCQDRAFPEGRAARAVVRAGALEVRGKRVVAATKASS